MQYLCFDIQRNIKIILILTAMNSTYYWLIKIHFKKKKKVVLLFFFFFSPGQRVKAKSKWEKSWTVGKRRKKGKKKAMEREWEIQIKSHKEKEVRNRKRAEDGGRRETEIGISSVSSIQSLSRVWLFVTPWIAARQASLSITNSRSSLKLMPIESVMPSSHLILCRPFSSCPQSLPASGSFPMSQLFTSGGQSTWVSASTSVLPMNTQGWSPLGWTLWISLQS